MNMNNYLDNRTLLTIGNRFNLDNCITDMQKACDRTKVRTPALLAVYQVNSARILAVYEGALAPITASCVQQAVCQLAGRIQGFPPACWPSTIGGN